MMYAYSDLECLHRHFFVISGWFLLFAPPLIPKIKIWKKCEKTPGHIILLHMCAINQDHMMFGSWDMNFNRQNFFVILDILLTFYSPNTLKMKKTLEILSFYTGVPKIMIIGFTVPEIWHMSDVIFVFILNDQAFFQALFYNQ